MHFSSNTPKLPHRSRTHLQPLIIRLDSRNSQAYRSHLVANSAQNMKRISKLDRELARTNEQYQKEFNNFMEESKVCQVELFERLRSSQFSEIYRVRIQETGKHYALKKILLDDSHQSREEEICRKLKSNFVVRVIDIYKQDQSGKTELNILMDLYDWNLKELILGEERIQYLIFKVICYQMARAIYYVHTKGVTHRDVKPQNFLMRKNGRVVLCDFGSAKVIRRNEESIAYLNSRSYRAPELLLGSGEYTNAVDIWAMGCVMVQLVTKREIFKGSSTLDCLLNISRVLGSKDLKRLKHNEQITKMLPVVKGTTLAEHLREQVCPLFLDLLEKMLKIKSEQRIRAVEVLAHPFFDQLRDQQTFHEIIKEKMDISDFLTFSTAEIRNCEEHKNKLIPIWKRDRSKKILQTQ